MKIVNNSPSLDTAPTGKVEAARTTDAKQAAKTSSAAGPDQFNAPNIRFPGNISEQVTLQGFSGMAGIIDTIEHPCCCKLLVDLEWISIREGLLGLPTNQPFTLPVF